MRQRQQQQKSDLVEHVIRVNRVAKVVKGGRRFSFSALVVIGDGKGQVGYGLGKANELTEAIRKGVLRGTKAMRPVQLAGHTIIHPVYHEKGSARIFMKPGPLGSGIIASGTVRAIMDACGVQDVSAKSLGTQNPHNVIKAALEALYAMRSHEQTAQKRGIPVDRIHAAAASL